MMMSAQPGAVKIGVALAPLGGGEGPGPHSRAQSFGILQGHIVTVQSDPKPAQVLQGPHHTQTPWKVIQGWFGGG